MKNLSFVCKVEKIYILHIKLNYAHRMICSTFNESYYIAIIHVFYIVNILKVQKTQLKLTVKVLK